MTDEIHKCTFCGGDMYPDESPDMFSELRFTCEKCGRHFDSPKPEHDASLKGEDD